MPRLLVVEDQPKLLQSLERGLREEGYEVLTAADGREAYEQAKANVVDAVILDLMLPKRDGMDVLRSLRAEGFSKPVLILTARDEVETRVEGLDSGADDYLVKPFAFVELLARVRALIRRDVLSRDLCFQADDLEMNLVGRSVVRGGVEIDLTRREFELLEFLLRNKNTPVTREMIAREVWKEGTGTLTNTIDVYITLLRKKIEKTDRPTLIHTVRGVGYVLKDVG
ncbi:response regulator transcription factor [Planctomyces sp. SH-PL62]|uniref:response regulator transcription factor n=1 Tax=Planctomyces sp. SH-PL62 TaxID=1636152 RepID=UPI00078E892A|nr:response regulator transcription factor [Planctomyces sp. SH-PL62]AMV38651.1 Response regulator MprA [Planctomyces sp. SH-PL62]